jgi:cytochrome c2
LNRWFAVTSVLMTLSIVWMIWVDYDRRWREFQDAYFVGKAALAHLDFLDAIREDRRQDIQRAEQRLEDARQLVDVEFGAKRDELRAELVEVELKFKKADGPWGRARQVLDVTKDAYERAKEQYGPEHPRALEALKVREAEEERLEKLRAKKETWEDRKKELERQLKELMRPVDEAQKAVAELRRAAEDAAAKDREYRGVLTDTGLLAGVPLVKAIINMPLADFTAPKNTPGRQQVNQLVLHDVRQRLNYLEGYTIDRCTTCHVAIDDPDFSRENLARKLERSIPGINEELQRQGAAPLDPPTPPVVRDRGVALPAGGVTDHWAELTADQQEAYFEALLALVNEYLRQTGRKTIDLGQPILAHPDLDLYVTVDSPHPKARMGCTVCHEGNPQETEFILASHTPPTHEIEEEWKHEYYDSNAGIPAFTFETVEHYWDRPMRLPKYTQAGCAKCHERITDIARFRGDRKGERINLGRFLFTEVGCINCHNVDVLPDMRKVGPDLRQVASKLTPEFVQQWVYFPQKFRPSTRMPHFFLQENNRARGATDLDPQPELRTETEVAAISKYLIAVSRPWEPIEKPDGAEGDVERGRQLVRSVGCLACHGNIDEFGAQWITADLVHRDGIEAETATYRYKGMTYEERARYAMRNFLDDRDTFLKPDQARFDPDADVHAPVFTRFAPDLSGIGSKVDAEWLYSWLVEPTHYFADTKMPSLRLTPSEAADITAYLLSLRNNAFVQETFEMTPERTAMARTLILDLLSAQRSEARSHAILENEGGELGNMLVALLDRSLGEQEAQDLIGSMSDDDKRLMYLGNKMISHYGCHACHSISGFEDATPPGTDLSNWGEKPITQLDFAFFDNAFDEMRAENDEVFGYVYPRDGATLNYWSPTPDDAREQITHTHAAFAYHKMLNPRIWDRKKLKLPYDKLKMPNFYFSEEEAEALTTYLLSRVPPRVEAALKVSYGEEVEGPIADGRTLTRQLNCIACHEIEDNVPTIQQYFRREVAGKLRFDEVNAPPSLRGEGAKIQHNWFHRFVQQVEPLRPWLQARMPSFSLTNEQATTLVEYFAALSRRDHATLAEALARIDEHLAGASSPETDPWYEREPLETAAELLRDWTIERRLMSTRELDPLTTTADRLRTAHADVLDRTRFLRELYNVEYPFVEPPSPLSPDDRFDRGMRFLNDMGCLKCHVLGPMIPGPAANTDEFVQVYRLDGVRGVGDGAVAILNGMPYPVGSVIDGHTLVSAENVYYDSGDIETKAIVEGPNPDGQVERVMLQAATAPNLGLTYERLRRAWVFKWMLEPQWIQPGTKMPQNFRGGRSPFEGDPAYPGAGADHINLLVDSLYDAGAKNVRVPLQKIVVVEQPEDFEEGEQEFFDE